MNASKQSRHSRKDSGDSLPSWWHGVAGWNWKAWSHGSAKREGVPENAGYGSRCCHYQIAVQRKLTNALPFITKHSPGLNGQ